MPKVLRYLPELQEREMMYIQEVFNDLSEQQAEEFAMVYRSRRKDPTTILLLALIGFLGVAGIHRFVLDQIGMGILYILTAGLCFIGTIVDVVNYKDLAFEYNQRVAQEVLMMVR